MPVRPESGQYGRLNGDPDDPGQWRTVPPAPNIGRLRLVTPPGEAEPSGAITDLWSVINTTNRESGSEVISDSRPSTLTLQCPFPRQTRSMFGLR